MDREILAKGYEPGDIERKWYKYWVDNNLFQAKGHSDAEPFCIVIPPPNVTGTLHMGHALNNTLQDILCRYKKMKGFNVLWQPGTDHAGIATQNVVEKSLASQGTDRHAVGREKFEELVWEWREKYGGIIINQLKRLGCSCDWSRERFTMDKGLSRAVKEVFVRLYEEGLIYRGDYIINWCPRCHTALADIEVEHEDMNSFLYYIRYPFVGRNGHLTVATTRPETLLGDTAVAVNPRDERYGDISGASVLLPIMNRPIPVIFEDYVDTEFGTGALKITPAHDPNDFEIGNTHNLQRIKVIDENGRMNSLAGPYQGMDRFECREKILKDIEDAGLLEKVDPYQNAIGHCYRCKTMIEPLLSKQWFVRTAPLAKAASDAVREGKTRITPASWEGTYFDWMDNIRDWCVSRQIWWGHRIPAWYCNACGEVHVAKEAPQRCRACSSEDLVQETDVLDTWFSSALWPFSTLGWPGATDELKTFYPTSVLITGFDILFFWVARMMMMGIHFMGDIPFKDVYIHALVRDAEGKKMSKSKGNVIDPLVVMDEFGTDAFRFTLAALAAQGRDVKLSEERIEGYRHFVNKIWNASRFALMNLQDKADIETGNHTLADRWILTRLGQVSTEVAQALDSFRFNEAAGICYQFIWHELCDWYLEMAKQGLYGDDKAIKDSTMETVKTAIMGSLKLLHPFMPFVTEEIWHKFTGGASSIMLAEFPKPSDFMYDKDALKKMDLLMGVINGVRNIRGEMNIPPSKSVSILLDMADGEQADIINDNITHIKTLAKVDSIRIESGAPKPEASATAVFGRNQVHVLLKGLLDFDEERKRIGKEIQKIEKEIEASEKKLSNHGFMDKAPADVVEKVKQKVDELSLKREKLKHNLSFFEKI
ncbi:Valine--tRNA ligase [uncultured Desulfobacterium sp.]|uniref:Valine--tRNA ligase n=1 Tax=uncultured Desulfobacterium sp. TaxID=201089 RepID=A0A445MTF0_9BACT|nr:Valine--tRNA ligase [uncultured Desulfobacterium sp.]